MKASTRLRLGVVVLVPLASCFATRQVNVDGGGTGSGGRDGGASDVIGTGGGTPGSGGAIGTGGSTGSGGTGSGGAATGGRGTGGAATGGTATGGAATGGRGTGGAGTGGAATGGAATGGRATGGAATGGAATGGRGTGGAGTGGAATGGAATGGRGTGGAGTGGAATGGAGTGGAATGGAGAGVQPSCNGLPATCGPAGASDCCASSLIPGGTFNRSNDPMYPATVSPFRLDIYEITVGRFRKFVTAFGGGWRPAVGSGKNPNNAGDPGWAASFTLPADAAALVASIKCDANITWTDTASANETRPMGCFWEELAFAFCIWDGGRMPTEAEWNFAAAGGAEQRYFPWSNPPTSQTIDETYAVYQPFPAATVGSKSPLGDGKWGQADMAGNQWEWVQDWHADYRNPCVDCAAIGATSYHVVRGGSIAAGTYYLPTGFRGYMSPRTDAGARCARAP